MSQAVEVADSRGPVVIVGAGIGGVRTARKLRSRGYTGELVVVGAESHQPYDRPPLSKDVLHGGETRALLTDAAREALDVRWRLGVTATGVDTARRVLATDAGEVAYSALVLAPGARARRLPGVPGTVLRTHDDAADLRGRLGAGRVVAVIGAGVLGCEIAASAVALGGTAHLIDLAPAPMLRVVGRVLAAEIAALHERHGVELHLGVVVADSADAAEGRTTLTLSDGTVLHADAVVHAIGVSPDIDWLAGSGLLVDGALHSDGSGRASAADVYALGDAATWNGHRTEHWTAATEQADIVAAALLGQDPPPPPVAYWWSDQHGIKLQGLGETGETGDARGGGEVWLGAWGPQARRVALYSRDGMLTGAVGWSAPAAIMPLRGPIQQAAPIGEFAEKFAAQPERGGDQDEMRPPSTEIEDPVT